MRRFICWQALGATGLLVVSTACNGTWLKSDKKYSAFDVCTRLVKQQLKSPGNAIFRDPTAENGDTTFTPSRGGNVYAISSSVDIEHGVGPTLRSMFNCTATHVEGDAWSVTRLDIHDGGYTSP